MNIKELIILAIVVGIIIWKTYKILGKMRLNRKQRELFYEEWWLRKNAEQEEREQEKIRLAKEREKREAEERRRRELEDIAEKLKHTFEECEKERKIDNYQTNRIHIDSYYNNKCFEKIINSYMTVAETQGNLAALYNEIQGTGE
jgi:hypothetical protein